MRALLAAALMAMLAHTAAADPVTQVIHSAWDPMAGALNDVPEDTGATMFWATDQGGQWGTWAAGQGGQGGDNVLGQLDPLVPL
ncbi:MAG TPA: hypothetical protein VGR28_01520 [Candidatus Thermoplasmatota archaeon]|jgi:hypothetical protein|nr:hypothetical protein [Candidatus Thermoplasmatota archaeon]